MTSPGFGRHVDLASGAALHLDDARGTTLRVTRGQLWITQHGDPRDLVLGAGDAWTIERNGLTIAAAQKDSSVALAGSGAAQVDARGRRIGWTERLFAWLAALAAARAARGAIPYL